jgi:hypothetical protein
MQQIAENIWLLRYPMPVLGIDFSRNVSIVSTEFRKIRNTSFSIGSLAP